MSSYFKTPNDVYDMNGTIFMEDGSRKNWRITKLFENYIDLKDQSVGFVPEGETTSQRISVNQIKFYAINDNVFLKDKAVYARSLPSSFCEKTYR